MFVVIAVSYDNGFTTSKTTDMNVTSFEEANQVFDISLDDLDEVLVVDCSTGKCSQYSNPEWNLIDAFNESSVSGRRNRSKGSVAE